MRFTQRFVLVALAVAPFGAGQSAAQTFVGPRSPAEIAAHDPRAAVDAELAGRRPLLRARGDTTALVARRVREGSRGEAVFTLAPRGRPSTPERCYLLVGAAGGTTNFAVRLPNFATPREVQIAAAARGGVSSTRFCVPSSAGPISATAAVSTSVAVRWAVAVLEAPPPQAIVEELPDVGASARERLARALSSANGAGAADAGASTGGARATLEIGGGDLDFVGRQIREAYAAVNGARAVTTAARVTLQTANEHAVSARLELGRCYEAAAFGVPSVADIDVSWFDSTGARVAQDNGRRSSERVRFCPTLSGTYRASARVFAGGGLVLLQLLEVPTS